MSEALLLKAESKERRTNPWGRVLFILLLVLFFLALLELIFSLAVLPKLSIRHLEVKSDFAITEEQILAISGLEGAEYYFSIDPGLIEEKLLAYPLVKEVVVTKIFPDTVRVSLKGRKPLAASFAVLDDDRIPVVIDEEGVVFQIGKSISQWDLPIISGLRFKPLLGIQLPESLFPLLGELDGIRRNAPLLFEQISEVKIVSTGEDRFEFILFPVSSQAKVYVGERLDENLLQKILLVIDVMTQQGLAEKIKELDFRTGEVVYKLKED